MADEFDELTKDLENLQSSTLNCGGTWRVRRFEKDESENARSVLTKIFSDNKNYDNIEAYREHQSQGGWNPEEAHLTKNIELISINNWEEYLHLRLDYWSNFELISKEEMQARFDSRRFENNETIFFNKLKSRISKEKDYKVYRMNEDKFDTCGLWWHQIHEDIIFELKRELLILNFGWSS